MSYMPVAPIATTLESPFINFYKCNQSHVMSYEVGLQSYEIPDPMGPWVAGT